MKEQWFTNDAMGDTKMFILFKRFDDERLRQWNSLLGNLDSSWPLQEVNYCPDSLKDYFTDEGVHRRNVWKE